MKKLLYISNIGGKKMSGTFSGTAINAAKRNNYEYHSVANRSNSSREQTEIDEKNFGIKLHHADINRNPLSWSNIKAYKQIIDLIKEEKFDFIHCNTPVGGLLGRLAGAKCNVNKIIYQVHGFHFYKGAPIRNWLIYYPIERFLARFTDAIIAINQEDYEMAQSFSLRNNGHVYYVPGVGVDLSEYRYENKSEIRIAKREELGLHQNDVMVISAGDLIERKNYALAIKAIAATENRTIHYFICGKGPEETKLRNLANNLGISEQIHFLGFRSDVKELMQAADIFLFTTKQEGLSRALMEAMASGLPCVASSIRGNTDLMSDGKGGFLCKDIQDYVESICRLSTDVELRKKMSNANLEKIKNYSVEAISDELYKVYSTEFSRDNIYEDK